MRSPAKSLGYVGDQVNWSHPQARGLVGFWPLNDGAGTAALDLGGRLSGVAGGAPAWKIKHDGPAIYFDGVTTGKQVTIPNFGAWTELSICFYLSCLESADSFARIIEKGLNSEFTIVINKDSNNHKLSISYGNDQNNTSSLTVDDGKTRSICVTFTAGKYVSLYADGMIAYGRQSTGTVSGASGDVYVGANPGAATVTRLKGSVWGLRIYNRALSANEIRGIYINPTAIYRPRSLILPVNALMAQPPIYIGGQRISKMMLGGNEVSGAAIGSSRFW